MFLACHNYDSRSSLNNFVLMCQDLLALLLLVCLSRLPHADSVFNCLSQSVEDPQPRLNPPPVVVVMFLGQRGRVVVLDRGR